MAGLGDALIQCPWCPSQVHPTRMARHLHRAHPSTGVLKERGDALITCPLCPARVQPIRLGGHLGRAHRLAAPRPPKRPSKQVQRRVAIARIFVMRPSLPAQNLLGRRASAVSGGRVESNRRRH
jgi:hypothetical protein